MEDLSMISNGTKTFLTEEEIKFFDWVHEIAEHHKYNPSFVPWNDGENRALFKEYGIVDKHDKINKPIEITSSLQGEVQFKCPNGKKVSKKFIEHLRNSYAHLYIERIPASGAIHLQDWKPIEKGKIMVCTMDLIVPFDFLKKLTELILRNYIIKTTTK